MMAHSIILQIGMRVEIEYTGRKRMDCKFVDGVFAVEAIGYDWIIFRNGSDAYAITFATQGGSTDFMRYVVILEKGY